MNEGFDVFGLMGMSSKVTSQQAKDFRKLESSIVKVCANQCLRKEKFYGGESELCMAKCYDLAYIYTRVGL